MAKILREPLLHFLLLSGVLFLVFHLSDSEFSDSPSEEIVVSEGRIRTLISGFERVWRRKPNSEELDGLIETFVHEEVMYREAKALGLDRDDPVVRRRMRQKLAFISEDLITLTPTQEQLQQFLDKNPAQFRRETRFSFRQLYFNINERGASVDSDIEKYLEDLVSSDADVEISADQLMIPTRFSNAGEREIARSLGAQFLDELTSAPTGRWYGPVSSGFGLHLVYISNRTNGTVPRLSDVRTVVEREWAAVARKQSNEAFYTTLRQRYRVKVAEIARVTMKQPTIVKLTGGK
jgi:parvulin-like peptidyl-prolyl isomerase